MATAKRKGVQGTAAGVFPPVAAMRQLIVVKSDNISETEFQELRTRVSEALKNPSLAPMILVPSLSDVFVLYVEATAEVAK